MLCFVMLVDFLIKKNFKTENTCHVRFNKRECIINVRIFIAICPDERFPYESIFVYI